MCSIDDCEPCSTWVETFRVVVRRVKCTECKRAIDVGETYLRIFAAWDGTAGSLRICAHCCVAAKWLKDNCGGFTTNGVVGEIIDHAQEYKRWDLWCLYLGVLRKWRKRSGELMPAPALPAPLASRAALRSSYAIGVMT